MKRILFLITFLIPLVVLADDTDCETSRVYNWYIGDCLWGCNLNDVSKYQNITGYELFLCK